MGDSGLGALLDSQKRREERSHARERLRREQQRLAEMSDDSSDGARHWGKGGSTKAKSGGGPRVSGEASWLDSHLDKMSGKRRRDDDSSDDAPARRKPRGGGGGGGGFYGGTGLEDSDSDNAASWGKMGGFSRKASWQEEREAKEREEKARSKKKSYKADLTDQEQKILAEKKLDELSKRVGGGQNIVEASIAKEEEQMLETESAWINDMFAAQDRQLKHPGAKKKKKAAAPGAAAKAAPKPSPKPSAQPAGGKPRKPLKDTVAAKARAARRSSVAAAASVAAGHVGKTAAPAPASDGDDDMCDAGGGVEA